MARKSGNTDSFEEKLQQLESIVTTIESPDCPLEKAIDLCAQGMALYAELRDRLTKLERKVYEVKNIKALAEGKSTEPEMDLFPADTITDTTETKDGEHEF